MLVNQHICSKKYIYNSLIKQRLPKQIQTNSDAKSPSTFHLPTDKQRSVMVIDDINPLAPSVLSVATFERRGIITWSR